MDERERDSTEILREGPRRGKFTVWPYQVGIVMRSGEVVDIFSEGERRLPRGEVRTYVASTAPFHLTFWLKDPGDATQPSEGVALEQPVLTADGQLVTGRIDLTLSVVPKQVEYLLQLLGQRGAISEQEVADAIKYELLAKVLALDLHRHTSSDLRGNRDLFKGIYESLQIELTSTIRRYGLRLDNFYVNWGLTPEEQERIKEQRHRNIIRDIEREEELEELGGVQANDQAPSSEAAPSDEPPPGCGGCAGWLLVAAIVAALAIGGYVVYRMVLSDDGAEQATPPPAAAALPTETPALAAAPTPTTEPRGSWSVSRGSAPDAAPTQTSEPTRIAVAPPTDTPTSEATPQTAPAAARPTALPTMTSTSTPVPPPQDTPTATPTPTNTPAPTATPVPTPQDTPTPTNTPIPTATHTPTPVPTATHTPTPAPTATYTPTPTNTPIPTATHTPTPTSTPVPGGRIAFSSSKEGAWDIHIVNPDGSGEVRVTDLDGDEYSPVWSPDGRKIAFRHEMEENSDIYVVNADGSGLTRLTYHSKSDTNPVWSPDGQRIAFQSNRVGENWNIYVVNTDGLLLTQLSSDPARYPVHPAWSPDGQSIAFSESSFDDIYVTNVEGAEVNNLTAGHSNFSGYGPVWSPDGQRIAFWRKDYYSGYRDDRDIYVMNADGSGPTRLTTNAHSRDLWPVWSPDGQRIAFRSDRDENWNIYVVNADGSSPEARLTNDPQDDYFGSWSPDGQRIVFTRGSGEDAGIYVMNADGSGVTSLGAGQHAVWSRE